MAQPDPGVQLLVDDHLETFFEGKVEEIGESAHRLTLLAGQATSLLLAEKRENIRLTLENTVLKRMLAEKSRKLSKLRRSVRAFRGELLREMVYAAELTEKIEEGEIASSDEYIGTRNDVPCDELEACDWNEVGE